MKQTIDAANVLAWIRQHLVLLPVCCVLGGIAGIAFSYTVTPVYRVSAVAVQSRESDGGDLGSGLGGVAGLAALAGVSLGGSGDRVEATEFIKSRALAREFIQRESLRDELAIFAGKNLDDFPPERAVTFFVKDVVTVTEDKRTGVIKVAIAYTDKLAAAAWTNGYLRLANELLQQRAIVEADRRREYLEREIQKTQVVEIRQSAARLIESQLNAAMLAHTRADYGFRTVDPAVPAEARDKIKPKRSLLGVAGAILGLMVGSIVGLIMDRRRARLAPGGLLGARA